MLNELYGWSLLARLRLLTVTGVGMVGVLLSRGMGVLGEMGARSCGKSLILRR